MNIQKALNARIPRIRKPEWANQDAYIRLPLLTDGKCGSWAELYDDRVQSDVLGIQPGTQRLCVILPEVAEDDGYEAYTGPISQHEEENFAKNYVES